MVEKEKRIAELIKELKKLDVDVGITTEQDTGLKGVVVTGKNVDRQVEMDDATVIEIADIGHGFQIYKDFSKIDKEDTKLKRLVRWF